MNNKDQHTHIILVAVLLLLFCNISQASSILSCLSSIKVDDIGALEVVNVFSILLVEQDSDSTIQGFVFSVCFIYLFYILIFSLLLYAIAKQNRIWSERLRDVVKPEEVKKVKKPRETIESEDLVMLPILDEYDRELLEKVIVIIEEHIGNPELKASFLAQKVYRGRSTFFIKIKDITGHTPRDFISAIRLKKSKTMLLEEKEMTIGDIAFKLGFSDSSYFIKVFKNKEGVTPHQFRMNEMAKKGSDK